MNKEKMNELLDETEEESAFFSEWNELDRAIAALVLTCFGIMFAVALLAIWG